MTQTERLMAAGYSRKRATDECGEALTTRRGYTGLACTKGGTWAKQGEPDRCAQHALLATRS